MKRNKRRIKMSKKYDVNGQEVEVIQQLDSGSWLVYDVCEDEYEENYTDEDKPRIATEIFEKPPTKVYEEKIAGLKKEIGLLKKNRTQLNEEIRKAETEKQNFEKIFNGSELLRQVYHLVNGDYKYYVGYWDGRYMNLLENPRISKFVLREGKWCSDYMSGIEFFVNKEDAIKSIMNWMESRVSKAEETWDLAGVERTARENNLTIPELYHKKIKALQDARKAKERENLQEKLKKLEGED
jgi:hypothetical protein